jgi:hypothetical protein
LKRESVEVCLNCKKSVKCEDVGTFEECVDFEEVEGEVWVITTDDHMPCQLQLARAQRAPPTTILPCC